jgi:N-acetylglucosaminyldiphosphoundecaprenol N-acetyl-beta-D-mannosaminyltransferase
MDACCRLSIDRGYSHYFYGGQDGVAPRLIERLTSRYPGLRVAGWSTPPFRALTSQEDADTVRAISAARPEIVWVGLSTPKQERWMADHVGRIDGAVLIGVGAAFDFHAGLKRQAPGWMQRSGLEWSFRLATEPRRLWRRYGRIVPEFAWRVLLSELGIGRPHHPSAVR